jgi:hypothetical protein
MEEAKSQAGLFAHAALGAFFNVLLLPSGRQGMIIQMALALCTSRLLHLFRVPTVPQALFQSLSGQAPWTAWPSLVLGWGLGSLLALPRQTSAPWQVGISGVAHGFLLAATGHDKHQVFATLTQCTWMSGAVAPLVSDSWPWLFATPMLLAAGTFVGMMLARLINKRAAS